MFPSGQVAVLVPYETRQRHFTFLPGLQLLPVALLLPETLLCLGWGHLAFATGAFRG